MTLRLLGVLGALALLPSAASAATCNGTPKRGCLLPFPSNVAHTKKDKTSATGRRVAFTKAEMPANAQGVHIDPTEWNRNDGFSPGQGIVVHVPSLKTQADLAKSKIVPDTDLARYKDKKQPLLLLDEKTGTRSIVWGELDANATTDASRNLLIHPAKNLVPGRTYVVVLRFLKDKTPTGMWKSDDAGCSQGVEARRRLAQERLRGVRLHGRVGQVADQSPAGDPQRRVQAARRHQSRRRQDPGRGAEVLDHVGAGLHRGREPQAPADDQGHGRSSVLPEPDRLPGGRAVPLLVVQEGRAAHADPGQRPGGAVPVQHPARGAVGAVADRHLRPRPAR